MFCITSLLAGHIFQHVRLVHLCFVVPDLFYMGAPFCQLLQPSPLVEETVRFASKKAGGSTRNRRVTAHSVCVMVVFSPSSSTYVGHKPPNLLTTHSFCVHIPFLRYHLLLFPPCLSPLFRFLSHPPPPPICFPPNPFTVFPRGTGIFSNVFINASSLILYRQCRCLFAFRWGQLLGSYPCVMTFFGFTFSSTVETVTGIDNLTYHLPVTSTHF